jgi:uncharacterized membrane protein YjjP (DUF1212 family)
MSKQCFYYKGIIYLLIGITLVGLGVGLLFGDKWYQFLIIGFGTGLVITGIILLKTYRYLAANKWKSI